MQKVMRYARRRSRAALATVVSVSMLAGMPGTARGAAPLHQRGDYLTTTGKPPGETLTLRTRGYYPVDTCLFYDSFCLRRSGGFRPEATAQAKVIQALNVGLGARPAEDPVNGTRAWLSPRVQWEVAPGPGATHPDTTWAPGKDSDSEMEETEEDIPNTCPNGDLTGPFRVDVLIDDHAGGMLGMYEVKRWAGPATVTVVNNQLVCYRAKAGSRGFTLTRDQRLNRVGWTKVYPDNVGDLWCAWADRADAQPGNIYFGKMTELPQYLRDTIPGCDSDTEELVKKAFKAFLVAEAAVAVSLVIIAWRHRRGPMPPRYIKAPPNPAECVTPDSYAYVKRISGCRGRVVEPVPNAGPAPSLPALDQPAPPMPVAPVEASGPIACGQTLTGHTTLTEDIGPCPEHGIVIGASGITLDLNGHKIVGDTGLFWDLIPYLYGSRAGIYNGGFDNVTITDRTASYNAASGTWDSSSLITGFNGGIHLVDGANSNTVEKLNIVGNIGIEYTGDGVLVENSHFNTVRDNNVVANGAYGGITLLRDSDDNIVEGNFVTATGFIGGHQGGDLDGIGIRLEPDGSALDPWSPCVLTPDRNIVRQNMIVGNVLDGVSALAGECEVLSNQVSNNEVAGNGRDGIRLNHWSKSTTVKQNAICDNSGAGIRVVPGALGNTIADNDVGAPAPCGPNNPLVIPALAIRTPWVVPQGDLHEGNVNCGGPPPAGNEWKSNAHVTEYAPLPSTLAIPPTTDGVPDYVCVG